MTPDEFREWAMRSIVCIDGPLLGAALKLRANQVAAVWYCNARYRIHIVERARPGGQHPEQIVPFVYRVHPDYIGFYTRARDMNQVEAAYWHPTDRGPPEATPITTRTWTPDLDPKAAPDGRPWWELNGSDINDADGPDPADNWKR